MKLKEDFVYSCSLKIKATDLAFLFESNLVMNSSEVIRSIIIEQNRIYSRFIEEIVKCLHATFFLSNIDINSVNLSKTDVFKRFKSIIVSLAIITTKYII